MAPVIAGFAVALAVATVSAQTPTPTALPSLPAAPSDPMLAGGVFTWVDNSDNEDGFRITVQLSGDLSDEVTELQFEVGPDVTSFPLPPEATIQCPSLTSIFVSVVAFNTTGESASVEVDLITLCPAAPTATPPATAGVLPDTGASAGPGEPSLWLLWIVAAAGTLTAFGALAWRLSSRGSSA